MASAEGFDDAASFNKDSELIARKAKAKVFMYDCGLYYPDSNFVIDGKRIGFKDNLRADLVVASRNDKRVPPYVALSIRLPKAKDDPRTHLGGDGKPADHVQVVLRFLPGKFQTETYLLDPQVYKQWFNKEPGDRPMGIVRVTMVGDHRPDILGSGIVYRGEKGKHFDEEGFPLHEFPSFSTLNLDPDFVTIRKIMEQKDFHIILKNYGYRISKWLLRVVQVDPWNLLSLEKPSLFEIRKDFMENDIYRDIRRFLKREIKFAELKELQQASKAVPKEAEDEDGEDVFETLPSPYTALWDLISASLTADFVCTTPYTSQESPYKKVCQNADAVILDEAGAMHKADALAVWGPFHRPCAMAGDENQPPPTVMEPYKNRFAADARISILEHHKMTGQPFFVMNVQPSFVMNVQPFFVMNVQYQISFHRGEPWAAN